MKKTQAFVAVLIYKIIYFFLKICGQNAMNFPGKMAMYICYDVVKYIINDMRIVIITGTNGKTTTSHLIANGLIANKDKVITNSTGANMDSGIISIFLKEYKFMKKATGTAVIECDELYVTKIMPWFLEQEVIVVVTNVFRDQLDRYGEIASTAKAIAKGIAKMPSANVVINGDCPILAEVIEELQNPIFRFGATCQFGNKNDNSLKDVTHCHKCGGKLKFNYTTIGHLGDYQCSECDNKRLEPEFYVSKIISQKMDSTEFLLNMRGSEIQIASQNAGLYNLYNTAAAAVVMWLHNASKDVMKKSLEETVELFGRMELIKAEGISFKMILVKNMVGMEEMLKFISKDTIKEEVLFVLNDAVQDGKDVSWIWDAQSDTIKGALEGLKRIYFSGSRSYDMAIRMKYAGVDEGNFIVNNNLKEMLDFIKNKQGEKTIYALVNYSSMMELRGLLGKK